MGRLKMKVRHYRWIDASLPRSIFWSLRREALAVVFYTRILWVALVFFVINSRNFMTKRAPRTSSKMCIVRVNYTLRLSGILKASL